MAEEKMAIRPMKPDDLPRVMEIWLRATVQGHPFLPESYWLAHQDEVRDQWIPASETTVAELDGVAVGFLSVVDGAYIGALFVDPTARGKGIGSALVHLEQSRRARLTLEVYRENTAVRFYELLGFQCRSERPDEENGHILCGMVWGNDS